MLITLRKKEIMDFNVLIDKYEVNAAPHIIMLLVEVLFSGGNVCS